MDYDTIYFALLEQVEVNIKAAINHFLPLSSFRIIFIRLSAIFFVWNLFGFLSYFPGIDGLKWRAAIRIGAICLFCAFGLWFATLKLAARYRMLKLLLLIPSLIFFPMVCYALHPILLGVAILSLGLAIHHVVLGGKFDDRPSQTEKRSQS